MCEIRTMWATWYQLESMRAKRLYEDRRAHLRESQETVGAFADFCCGCRTILLLR